MMRRRGRTCGLEGEQSRGRGDRRVVRGRRGRSGQQRCGVLPQPQHTIRLTQYLLPVVGRQRFLGRLRHQSGPDGVPTVRLDTQLPA